MPPPALYGRRQREIADTLWRIVAEDRLPQTLLFAGPEGVGKATLARHLAAGINCNLGPCEPCGDCSACRRILATDLSQEPFKRQLTERRTLPAAKRAEAPLVIATYTDVLIFPPDGPMQIIGIDQAIALRKAARLSPSEGRRRIFIIEHAERANAEAANALLKTLEEPAPNLTIVLTSENPYLLPATIRSRSVPFFLPALTREEMAAFLARRPDVGDGVREQVATWSQGSPGVAVSLNVEEFLRRRDAMLALVGTALSSGDFAELVGRLDKIARRESEGIEALAAMISSLLRDLLRLHLGVDENLTHRDIRDGMERLASRVTYEWTERASEALDELEQMRQRNIQKQIALEAYALALQR